MIADADDESEGEDGDQGAENDTDSPVVSNELYAFFRLQSAGDAAQEGAFQGRIEISHTKSDDETKDHVGFEVIVAYETGDRRAFWKAADTLKAATVRSGRQWRRKRQHSEQPVHSLIT